MQIRLLGSAAGGGLPQWNCNCSNCLKARKGEIPQRTQSCVAFSRDGVAWFLINASPDIRSQLQGLPGSKVGRGRSRMFEGVILSNGDLDHTLGLMVVREGGPVATYCTEEVRRTVSHALGFEQILGAFFGDGYLGINWRTLDERPLELTTAGGEPTGLQMRTIMLGGSPPRYDPFQSSGAGHSCAFSIEDLTTGARFACALDVQSVDPVLLMEISNSDLAIVDGTFWSDREMIDLGFSIRTAAQMGHWAISGDSGSLRALTAVAGGMAGKSVSEGDAQWRPEALIVYSHINNTNPILDPGSGERAKVEAAGLIVGEDGMEWTI